MTPAHFTYFGETETKNREVKFFRRSDGMYVTEVENMPALKIVHPSKKRVMAAFKGWWEMAQKDYGASEIEWGDMASQEEQDEAWWDQLGRRGGRSKR